jgi:hypothetical protein
MMSRVGSLNWGVGYFDKLGNYHDGYAPVDDYDECWLDDEVPVPDHVDEEGETETGGDSG